MIQLLFWRVRFWAKAVVIMLGYGSSMVEYCEDCGRRQPLVWWCRSHVLWKRVMGGEAGVACPECFERRAQKLGIFLRWYPQDESRRANADSGGGG